MSARPGDCGEAPAGLQSTIDSVQALLASIELPAALQVRASLRGRVAFARLLTRAAQIGEQSVLDAFYQNASSRAELAARCEALAARARASAQAYLPASYAGYLFSDAAPDESAEELGDLRHAHAALEAVTAELRALEPQPAPLARLEEAGALLSRAVDATAAQLSSARAAAAELRGALEEALNDARDAEEKLCAERERANALEVHLRTALSARPEA
jgi:chromosome segregation ATPase